jgi:hypothetical protein
VPLDSFVPGQIRAQQAKWATREETHVKATLGDQRFCRAQVDAGDGGGSRDPGLEAGRR